jgi:hypothetical protein
MYFTRLLRDFQPINLLKTCSNISNHIFTNKILIEERSGAPMDQNDKSFLKVERKLIEWIIRLVRSDFKWLGRILLKALRFAWRHQPGPIESSPKKTIASPTGPYATKRR